MKHSLLYFQQLLYTRFELFFGQECEYNSIYELLAPEDNWIENLVGRNTITIEERVTLLLALAPHLFPQSLDFFLVPNKELSRPYTEFGGYEQAGHRGFMPTGETVAFLLAGTDPFKRLEVINLFNKQHWFYTENILELVHDHLREPILAGQLCASATFLKQVLEQSANSSSDCIPQTVTGNLYPHMPNDRFSEMTWNIDQAREYPCKSCTALCCRILHLEDFPLQHFRDLDKIRYYLNFPNLEVLLSANNKVTIYFSGFCGFLDRETITCKIHNQPEQPNLCVHYSPYNCFYKKADADKQEIVYGKLWLNKKRLDFLEQTLQFNFQREIIGIPSTEELSRQLNEVPYTECHENNLIQGAKEPATLLPPCSDCNSLCCSSLLFPGKQPESTRDLDFIRYTLGYPEVEYLIGKQDWIMKVKVRCKYLDSNNRCSVYEQAERPIYCRYFNPHKCTLKQIVKQDHQSIKLQEFNLISEHLLLDNDGNLEILPSLSEIKKIVTKRSR